MILIPSTAAAALVQPLFCKEPNAGNSPTSLPPLLNASPTLGPVPQEGAPGVDTRPLNEDRSVATGPNGLEDPGNPLQGLAPLVAFAPPSPVLDDDEPSAVFSAPSPALSPSWFAGFAPKLNPDPIPAPNPGKVLFERD